MCGWARLPHFVLASIFSYLSYPDRLSAALVCHQWLNGFHSPTLWREITCDFTLEQGNLRLGKAVKFVSNHGQHLRHLTISCKRMLSNKCPRVGYSVVHLLHALQPYSKLTHLSLRGFYFDCYWHQHLPWYQRTIDAIIRFLMSQKHLVYVDFTEMKVSEVEAIQVLTALSVHCAKSVQHLVLEDFLPIQPAICRNSSYGDVIKQWTGLQHISMNYSGLDATHLIAIARNNKKHFRTLVLQCCYEDDHVHVIPDFVWQQVLHLAPHLKVDWCFGAIPWFQELEPLLPRTLPLRSLQFWAGLGDWDERWELPRFFQYLTQHFSSCLENLELEDAEPLGESFLKLLKECRKLQVLKIEADLNVIFVDTLCSNIIADTKTGLKMVSLCGVQNSEALESIQQKYQSTFAARGIGFTVIQWDFIEQEQASM